MTGTSEDPSSALEELLVEALQRLERDGTAGVEELLERHPSQAARVRSYLGRVHRLGLVGDGSPQRDHPERLGEFRILSVLGQGGMGVVYRAVQESLAREVALKLVRPELLFFPGARERFQREVELVARMQHPGIVPVHAVGSEAGVPYFAMELVRGATLADVLADLGGREAHTLSGADLDLVLARRLGEEPRLEPAPLLRGAWTEVVLRILRELAEALEHAHRRGVLHRDVKPSNVMITREGRVLLVDFGLAGAQGAERTTRTGSQLGSLAYMAPELLAGSARELDARSDVYALGATGWELFTLRLPYASSDPIRLRELAGTARRPRLDSIHPGLGWDVETVIATALEPDPERRYASAAQLARDLDHLLARRPIEAREIGPGLRLRRWSQRHPARATALAALALALVLGPLAWAWQAGDARRRVQRERDALAAANVELDAARTQAERHFHSALSAIGEVLRRTASDELADVPRLQRARLAAIERAQALVAELERDRPGDVAVTIEGAALQAARAEVLYDQGRFDEALADCRAAAAALAGARGDEASAVRTTSRHLEAKVLQSMLRWAEAEPIQRELAQALRDAFSAAPEDDDLKRRLALMLADLSESMGRAFGREQSREVVAEGLELARELAADWPDVAERVWTQGRLAADSAHAALNLGDLDGAAALAAEALEANRAAAGLAPEDRSLRLEVAKSLAQSARIEFERGRDGEASYREGLKILDALNREFPEAERYRLEQARLLDELAQSVRKRQPERSLLLHREAIALYDALVSERPEGCQSRFAAAVALNNYGNHLIHYMRDFPAALEALERAAELIEPCRARISGDVSVSNLATLLSYLHALALCLSDQPARARAEIEAFDATAGEKADASRYASDLWCEWLLARRRRGELEQDGRERMFAALERAIELGYRDVQELRTTAGLDSFRNDPAFLELLARIE